MQEVMTTRTPPRRTNPWRTLLAGGVLMLWSVGCTEPPAATPDAARKDAAAEVDDLGGDVDKDVPDVVVDDAGAPDAAEDEGGPEETGEEPESDAAPDVASDGRFTPEDIPESYDIQLDRSWDALADGTLVPVDVSAIVADRTPPTPPGIPCTIGSIETCACIDGREGWQVCEHTRVFSECTCAMPPAPPFPLPPRLVHPLSGTRVTSQRPTLRWVLPDGVTRARVELCADRPCTRMLAQQEVTGATWRSARRLTPGVVFWRVRGLDAAGAVVWTSATWLFQVRARDAAADTAYGRIRDFNGDGYDDLVIPQQPADEGGAEMHVFFGSAQGIGPQPELVLRTPASDPTRAMSSGHIVADLTGDGLADLYVTYGPSASSPRTSWSAYLYEGHRQHPLARRIAFLRFERAGAPYLITVDYDADGIHDLFRPSLFYHGSTSGPVEAPQEAATDRSDNFGTFADMDGDGYVEYIVDHMHYRPAYGRFPLLPRETWHLAPWPGFIPDFFPDCPVLAGDMDGDQRADLLAYCWVLPAREFYGTFFPIYGRMGGLVRGALQLLPILRDELVSPSGYRSSGDFNGDGRVDHLLDFGPSGVSWVYGANEGELAIPVTTVTPVARAAACGDLNGDGFDETALVVRDAAQYGVFIVNGAERWSGRYTSRQMNHLVFSLSE